MEKNLKKIGINNYQIPRTLQMKADAVVYASPSLLKLIGEDLSLKQLQEAASLSKVISPVIGMPDIHQGFGLPIGGVMATKGLISAGAVGMDINCGVRLLTSNLIYNKKDLTKERLRKIITQIENLIPIGLGGKYKKKTSLDIKKVTEEGVEYLVKKGIINENDLQKIEENGRMQEASFEKLSSKAINLSLIHI